MLLGNSRRAERQREFVHFRVPEQQTTNIRFRRRVQGRHRRGMPCRSMYDCAPALNPITPIRAGSMCHSAAWWLQVRKVALRQPAAETAKTAKTRGHLVAARPHDEGFRSVLVGWISKTMWQPQQLQ